jgi:hypothetical protein
MTAGSPTPMADWPPANRAFFHDFRDWLRAGGYGDSALKLYAIAARLALGLLDKPYREIDSCDMERVWKHVTWRTTPRRRCS